MKEHFCAKWHQAKISKLCDNNTFRESDVDGYGRTNQRLFGFHVVKGYATFNSCQ